MPLPDKLSESKALKSLQDFIEDQEANPIVPQRDINPDQLKKKINQIPDLNNIQNKQEIEQVEQNGLKMSKKSSILDGAVNITGGPTIRSIKNLRKKNDFKLKMKRKNEVDKTLRKSIEIPKKVIKPKASTYIPQNAFKYTPQVKRHKLIPRAKVVKK